MLLQSVCGDGAQQTRERRSRLESGGGSPLRGGGGIPPPGDCVTEPVDKPDTIIALEDLSTGAVKRSPGPIGPNTLR